MYIYIYIYVYVILQALEEMMAFTAGEEEQLNNCLYNGIIPDPDLVEKIAVCKIRCIQVAPKCTSSPKRTHSIVREHIL